MELSTIYWIIGAAIFGASLGVFIATIRASAKIGDLQTDKAVLIKENKALSDDYLKLKIEKQKLVNKQKPVAYDEIEKFIDEHPIYHSTAKEIVGEMIKEHEEQIK